MNEKEIRDQAELVRINTALNNWMNRTFFGASPAKKTRKKRGKPCPKCGVEIGVTKPMCYTCFTNRDENGHIK